MSNEKNAPKNVELSEEQLEDVAGGCGEQYPYEQDKKDYPNGVSPKDYPNGQYPQNYPYSQGNY